MAAEEVAEEVAAGAEEVAAGAEEVAAGAEEVAAAVVFSCERKIDGQLSQLRSQLWTFQPRASSLQRLIGP
jgi:X-X-X-Leu-X-X-Gly heptad repeat protein